MNTKSISQAKNPVLAGSLPALKRAAARAKRVAAQTGTRLIITTANRSPKTNNTADKKSKTGRRVTVR
jgi:hypothetical protein